MQFKLLALGSLFSALCLTATAQSTAITYQGRLNNGANPANGSYDLTFSLYSAQSGGSQVGGTYTSTAVGVTNGLFTTIMDFGGAPWTGQSLWLQILVRTNGNGTFATLTPRQTLTPTPYAIYATTANNVSGTISFSSLPGFQGSYNTIGGGQGNSASGEWATVGGGEYNTNSGTEGTIGGGQNNTVKNGYQPTVGGGYGNTASANYATVAGGNANTASGTFATVPGGEFNQAKGNYSFAAGDNAQALNQGAFVWADSQGTTFASTANDQASFRCQGGVRFTSGSGSANQTVSWTPGTGSWSFTSDRNLKDRFEAVDAESVLAKVAQLPIVEWSYQGYPQRHIGAMAQDFHGLFPLNDNDKALNEADLHGVALAAIKGLNQKVEEQL